LFRSYLYVPATRPEFFPKAAVGDADAIVIDLEDAVAPNAKQQARENLSQLLLSEYANHKPVFVRVNGDEQVFDDIKAISAQIAGIRLPKCECADTTRAVDKALLDVEQKLGLMEGSIELIPMVETARGLFLMDDVVAASSRIKRFDFGAGDYDRDIGGRKTPERLETLFARGYIASRSRFLGLERPLGHVTSIMDPDTLHRICKEDSSIGFFGRSCIHPKQVAIINNAFNPTEQELAKARSIVEHFEARADGGTGAFFMPDNSFVDMATYRRAKKFVAEFDK